MTPREFRKAVVSLSGVIESEHMGHPDFRFEGRIFATLGAPSDEWAVVKFTPDQQRSFVASWPDVFIPCNGAWGRSGSTLVRLPHAEKGVVKNAIEIAYENLVMSLRDKKSTKKSSKKKSTSRTKKKARPVEQRSQRLKGRKGRNSLGKTRIDI